MPTWSPPALTVADRLIDRPMMHPAMVLYVPATYIWIRCRSICTHDANELRLPLDAGWRTARDFLLEEGSAGNDTYRLASRLVSIRMVPAPRITDAPNQLTSQRASGSRLTRSDARESIVTSAHSLTHI
ncbi:hypothetical protein HN011_011182 [Eciton burchellii]|nr:hypothetical protein HN011_011182 [Eciton burchellii]